MSWNLSERLRKLEQRQPPRPMRWHRIIGHTEAELAEQRSALEASSTWAAGDGVIERLTGTTRFILTEISSSVLKTSWLPRFGRL